MDQMITCPRCGDDAYELSSTNPCANPREGQQVAWKAKLSCGCTVNDYHVYYNEVGWV
jgi:hypothetical protein